MSTDLYRRREEEKREKDLAFLDRLRSASLAELEEIQRNHGSKSALQWKAVAIARALTRKRDP